MKQLSLHSRPLWAKTAIHGAVLATLTAASGLAWAGQSNPPCDGSGDGTVGISTTIVQCSPAADAVATVGTGVTVGVTSGSAVFYSGDLGNLQGLGSLTNNGTIESVGSGGSLLNIAVEVRNEILGTLTNNGILKASSQFDVEAGTFTAYGVFEGSQNQALAGTIANSATGRIEVDAVSSQGSAVATGIVISNNISSTGVIANAGTITVNAISNVSGQTYADARGRGISVDGVVQGSITNGGNLAVTAVANSGSYGGAQSVGIELDGLESSGVVTNSGSIQATANASGQAFASAYGLVINNFLGTFSNSGTITATSASATDGYVSASGLLVDSWVDSNVSTVNNSGTIRALISSVGVEGGGAGFNGYAGAGRGVLNNSGTISGSIGVEDNGLGYSVQSSNFDINNEASGRLIGALYAGAGDVSNAGLIDLPQTTPELIGGGGNIGRIRLYPAGYVDGTFTQNSTGTLRLAANSAVAGGYSQLYVQDTANLAGTLDVNVLNDGANLAVGETLTGVVQAGTINGTFSRVTDNSVLFNFKDVYYTTAEGVSYETPRVDLEVVKGLTATQAVAFTGNSPAAGAARAFDAVIDAGTTDTGLQAVITALGVLDTEKKVSDAISQTLPLLSGGSAQAAGSALSGINRVVQARIENNRGMSSGETFAGDKHVWFKPFGSKADQNDRSAVSGYKANTGGFAIGADGALSDVIRAGVAFAYAQSDVTSNSSVAPQSNKVDVYQLIGYGSYALDPRSELNFQVDIGQNKNEGQRSIGFMGTVAKARYNSQTLHAGLGWARNLTVNELTSWTPSVRADYTRIKDSAYGETDAGALNLNVAGRSTEEFILAADAKVVYKLSEVTSLSANAGLGYDLMNKQASITAAFAGAPGASFVTTGLEQSPWMARAGLGMTHKTASGTELSARYDLEHREGFSNQTLSLKARWAF